MKPMKNLEPSNRLEEIVSRFSKEQMEDMMSNIGAIQLTEGCNTGCPDCGLEAIKGVRDYIPFDFLEGLLEKHKNILNSDFILYYASEPFDYDDGKHTYEDVHDMVMKKTVSTDKPLGYSPCVFTSLAKGHEKRILENLLTENKKGENMFVDCISLTDYNQKRFEKALKEILPELKDEAEKGHVKQQKIEVETEIEEHIMVGMKNRFKRLYNNTFGIVFPKKELDQSYRLKIKDSEELLKSLSSTDNLVFFQNSKRKMYVSNDDAQKVIYSPKVDCRLFLDEGKHSLYTLKMPSGDLILSEFKIDAETVVNYLGHKNWDHARTHGYGGLTYIMNFVSDYNGNRSRLSLGKKNIDSLSEDGIGCFNGVVIKPSGIYNLKTVKPSTDHSTGQILEPLDPGNFRVQKYKRKTL